MARSTGPGETPEYTRPPLAGAVVRTLLRIGAALAVALAASLAIDWVRVESDTMHPATANALRLAVNGLLLVTYAVLMALPFVPGIEIGVGLLLMRGADIAPWVYLATVSGLTLAFTAGRSMPQRWLRGFFLDLGLLSACRLIDRLGPLGEAERLAMLRERLPGWLGRVLLSHRYLLLAAALNLPGNALIGGGGGIALLSGLSRLFRPRYTLLTIMLAVSPVPIIVWFYGPGLLSGLAGGP